ncbi:MAG: TlpA disulfide reductase family protein [Pseudonocardiales bacterium]
MIVAGCSPTVHGRARPTASADHTTGINVTVFAADSRQEAPRLIGRTLDGNSVSLDYRQAHQIVVLNVWASWCAPCRDESPMLAVMAARLTASGIRFLGLDERDTTSTARTFVAAVHSNYMHLVDRDGALLLKLRVLPQVAIPSTLVLDRHGRMAARVIGPATASALQRIVDELTRES